MDLVWQLWTTRSEECWKTETMGLKKKKKKKKQVREGRFRWHGNKFECIEKEKGFTQSQAGV